MKDKNELLIFEIINKDYITHPDFLKHQSHEIYG